MSLDVSLIIEGAKVPVDRDQIWIREAGQTRQISRQEWEQRFPGRTPVTVTFAEATTDVVYDANITHNLGEMAAAADLYQVLWRPEDVGITRASQLIHPLRHGLTRLRQFPAHFAQFDAPNGWGTYPQLVAFVEGYLAACEAFPEAEIDVSR